MLRPSAATEKAYAKVNLALHVTGRLEDGYHAIDSLAAFVDLADELEVERSSDDEFHIDVDGPFADPGLATGRNLVMQAARLLQRQTGTSSGARFFLRKNIPVGAGLGGGAADAAAALRALNRLWQTGVPDANLQQMAAQIGADVPACISSQPQRMQRKGEKLSLLPALPETLSILLVNGNEPVLTSEVYQATKPAVHSGALPAIPSTQTGWLEAAGQATNDLQPAAEGISPLICEVLQTLNEQEGGLLVRMSGSGGTCFALFDNAEYAKAAKTAIQQQFSGWWCHLGRFINGLND